MVEVGTTIDGRYRVVAKLGAGGLAVVYKVEQLQLGTTHALKVLSRDGKGIRKRLFREGQLQGKLRHPNIAAVTDIVEVNGMPALIMEFVRGASLEELLVSEPLTLQQVDHIVRGIITGVGAAHRRGMIHRDLKPGNILLEVVDGVLTPKITDFGLAKALDEPSETQAGVMMGTPQYMPPEQIEDASSVDHRADVWSLGVILYELTTGVRPFEHSSLPDLLRLILDDVREPVTARNPSLPEGMVAAIEGALVAEVDERIPDCATLLALWTGEEQVSEVGGFSKSVLDRMIARGVGREPTPPTPAAPPSPNEVSTAETPGVAPPPPSPPQALEPAAEHETSAGRIAVVGAGALSLAGAAGALVLLLAAAGVILLWWSRQGEVEGAPQQVQTQVERPRPPRLLGKPRPEPAPAAQPRPGPQPAPASPRPSAPVAPQAVPRPAPAPSAPAPATPAPAAPAPAPAPPAAGHVEVSGGATSVGLVDSQGASFGPGPVPPGRYRVWARFPDEPYSEMNLVVDVVPGARLRIECDARLYGCDLAP